MKPEIIETFNNHPSQMSARFIFFFFLTERSAVEQCTPTLRCNLIHFRRDLEEGQNHIYQWLNLSLVLREDCQGWSKSSKASLPFDVTSVTRRVPLQLCRLLIDYVRQRATYCKWGARQRLQRSPVIFRCSGGLAVEKISTWTRSWEHLVPRRVKEKPAAVFKHNI